LGSWVRPWNRSQNARDLSAHRMHRGTPQALIDARPTNLARENALTY
jgi:hypothetical protein